MNFSFLSNTSLFRGITKNEIESLLGCLNGHVKAFEKSETIYRMGQSVSEIGMVISGSVNIVVNYYWGSSNIFSHIAPGQIFAENYAALSGKELLCDVVAAEKTEVLFLNFKKLLTTCRNSCPFHNRLICNLLAISAQKNLNLSARMLHTASKSIRCRLLSYFSEQTTINGSNRFTIPFSRQELSEYLGVDRSALSNELSKMQKDGLITYHKNHFSLNETAINM